MTAFSLVMLGKLVFLVDVCCCCVFTSESNVISIFLIKNIIFSFVYFIKLDVRLPKLFHSGRKKVCTRRATLA